MHELDIVFNVVVVMAFVAQVVNYWLLGQGYISRFLFLFVLGCFIITEGIVALDRPIYVLYVLLNMWGVYCFMRDHAE